MITDLGKTQKLLLWLTQKIYYNTAKTHQRKWTVKRGEVYFVDLGENIGSEENKLSLVLFYRQMHIISILQYLLVLLYQTVP